MTLAGQLVRFVVQFGSVILLARLLTPDDFGVVAMVTSVVGIAEIVRDFGLSSAAIQAKTLSHAERSNLWWINTGIGVLCTFFIVALAPLLARVYGDDRVVGIALVLSGLVIVSGAIWKTFSSPVRSSTENTSSWRMLGAKAHWQ